MSTSITNASTRSARNVPTDADRPRVLSHPIVSTDECHARPTSLDARVAKFERVVSEVRT